MTIHEAFHVVHENIWFKKFQTLGGFRQRLGQEHDKIERYPGGYTKRLCVAAGLLLGLQRFNFERFREKEEAYWREHARPEPPKPEWREVDDATLLLGNRYEVASLHRSCHRVVGIRLRPVGSEAQMTRQLWLRADCMSNVGMRLRIEERITDDGGSDD